MVRTIFCRWCDLPPWQWSHAHLHSRITNTHENPSIPAENTKIHGSIHSGTIEFVCATSGANNDKIDNTIGNPQQNTCGKILATIPIFTALFFMNIISLFLASPPGLTRHIVSACKPWWLDYTSFVAPTCFRTCATASLDGSSSVAIANSWRPHQDSNLDLILRRNLFYPVEL